MSKGISGLFSNTKGHKKAEETFAIWKPKKKYYKGPDFYVGSKGGVLLAKYKGWIGVNRRDRLLKRAKSKKLKNAVNQLYRPGAIIGDGSTASALKFEAATGLNLTKKDKAHLIKSIGFVKHLEGLINDESLSQNDRKLAKYLKKKLLIAIGGFKK